MPDIHNSQRKPRTEKESGQSLVEFALALIFIILPLTMVFIEASVLLYKYVALTNAAREGARAGSIYLYVGPAPSPTAPDAGRSTAVTEAVQDTLAPLIVSPSACDGSGSSTTCRISYGPPSGPIADPLRSTDLMTITLAHTHTFFFGSLGNEINIRARSSMRIEPSSIISGTGP